MFYCAKCYTEPLGDAVLGRDPNDVGSADPSPSAPMPIDTNRHAIVRLIANHRVSIIQGETGCGKSSRVPLMLLAALPDARLMVAQPRRIAAGGTQ